MEAKEKTADDRQKEREEEYDSELTQTRIDQALVRYERLTSSGQSRGKKPKLDDR